MTYLENFTIINQAEFTQLVKPLIKFLNENYSPYANIVITCNNAELSQTDVSLHTEEFFVDYEGG